MKRTIGSLIIIVSIMLLSGCTAKTPYYPPIKYTEKVTVPALNTLSKVEIGENLYEKLGNVMYKIKVNSNDLKNIHTNDNNETSFHSILNAIANGPNYNEQTKQKENEVFEYGSLRNWDNKDTLCLTDRYCLIDLNNTNKLTHISKFPNKDFLKLNNPIDYIKIPQLDTFTNSSYKNIVLYQGKIGNILKISFREFYNDLARPAFTQNIEYELDEKGEVIIGFKGLRIKVLEATNLNITYKVIKDYK